MYMPCVLLRGTLRTIPRAWQVNHSFYHSKHFKSKTVHTICNCQLRLTLVILVHLIVFVIPTAFLWRQKITREWKGENWNLLCVVCVGRFQLFSKKCDIVKHKPDQNGQYSEQKNNVVQASCDFNSQSGLILIITNQSIFSNPKKTAGFWKWILDAVTQTSPFHLNTWK